MIKINKRMSQMLNRTAVVRIQIRLYLCRAVSQSVENCKLFQPTTTFSECKRKNFI